MILNSVQIDLNRPFTSNKRSLDAKGDACIINNHLCFFIWEFSFKFYELFFSPHQDKSNHSFSISEFDTVKKFMYVNFDVYKVKYGG